MPARRVLVLGGTREARALAAVLNAAGHQVISSLAGVTQDPLLPEGDLRRGGFGGVEGLVSFLRDQRIGLIADATHPFATQISRHACAAAAAAGIACLRLERPAWTPGPGDRWTMAGNMAEAAAMLPAGAVVFAAVGRKEIAVLFARTDLGGVARMIEAPPVAVPPGWTVVRARPPFTVEEEQNLFASARITHLVARNSGAADSHAKLVAARTLGIPVVMLRRPVKPDAMVFPDVAQLVAAAGE